MTAAADSIEPRGMRTRDVAAYLGLSVSTYYTRRAGLEAAGFPAADPLTRRVDRIAIDAWLDQRAGLAHKSTNMVEAAEAALLARLDQREGAVAIR